MKPIDLAREDIEMIDLCDVFDPSMLDSGNFEDGEKAKKSVVKMLRKVAVCVSENLKKQVEVCLLMRKNWLLCIFFNSKYDMSNMGSNFYLRGCFYSTYYFCSSVYKVYKNDLSASKVCCKIKGSEAIFVCRKCMRKLNGYTCEEKPLFFDEVKQNVNSVFLNTPTKKLSLLRSV